MHRDRQNNYSHTLRCSKHTHALITGKACEKLFGEPQSYGIPQGILLKKMVETFLQHTQEGARITQEHEAKIWREVLPEYLTFNTHKKGRDVTIDDLIEAMITHYLKSDPR